MSATLSVEGLHFSYPRGRAVLAGVDIAIEAGERVALLGPNGAGKTTLALHVNGIHQGSAGTVAVGGVRVTPANAREIRARVGVVFQDPDDQLFMPTVGEDVAFGPSNYGVVGDELEQRVAFALDAVGLSEARGTAPQHLSFGQRRRAAIATILSMDVDVLVLDEPTSNVDARGRRDLIAALQALESTLIVVTHDLPLALELCPRALVMDGGRIVADGPTRGVLADAELLSRHGLELPWGFSLDSQ